MHLKLRLPPLSQVQLLDSRYSELLAFMANEMKFTETSKTQQISMNCIMDFYDFSHNF